MRYIQWFITFPLLLLELLLATGLSLSDIITTLFMAVVVVITGLVGALVPSTYKWGYYVFGVFALFYIWYVDGFKTLWCTITHFDSLGISSFGTGPVLRSLPGVSSGAGTAWRRVISPFFSYSTLSLGRAPKAVTSSRSPQR